MPPKRSLTWPVNGNFSRGVLKNKNKQVDDAAYTTNPFKKLNNKNPNISSSININNYEDLMYVDLNDFHYIDDKYTIEINVSFPNAIDFTKARNIFTFGYHIKGESSGEITIGTDPSLGETLKNVPVLGIVGKYTENTKKTTPVEGAVGIVSGDNTTYTFKVIYNPNFDIDVFNRLTLFVNDTLNSTSEGLVNLYNFSTSNRKLLIGTSGWTNEPTWEGKMDICQMSFINADFSSKSINYPLNFLTTSLDSVPSDIVASYENTAYYNNSLYISKNAKSGVKYSFKSNYPSSNRKVVVYDDVNNAEFTCRFTQTINDVHYCAGTISEDFRIFSRATIVIDDIIFETDIFPLTVNNIHPVVDNEKPTDVNVTFLDSENSIFKVQFVHVVDNEISSGVSISANTFKNTILLQTGEVNGALPSGNGSTTGVSYKLTAFLVDIATYDPLTFDLNLHPQNLIVTLDVDDDLNLLQFANVTDLYAIYKCFVFVTDHMNNISEYFPVYGTESGVSLGDLDAPEIKITNFSISGDGDKARISVNGYAFDEKTSYNVYALVTSTDVLYDLTEEKDKNKLQTVLLDNSVYTHVMESLSNTNSNLGAFDLDGDTALSMFYNGYSFSNIKVDSSYLIYMMNKDSSELSENTFVQYLNNLTIPRNIITIIQNVNTINLLSLNPNFDFTDTIEKQVAITGDQISFRWDTKFYEELDTPYELIVDGISYSNYNIVNETGTEFEIIIPVFENTRAAELNYSLYRNGSRVSPTETNGKVFIQHSLNFIESDWLIESQPIDSANFHNNVTVKGSTNTLLKDLLPNSLLQDNTGINQDIRLGYPFFFDLSTNAGRVEYDSIQTEAISSYDMSLFVEGNFTINDTTSNTRYVSVYGSPVFDSTSKSLIFDGQNDYLKNVNIGNTAGAWSHSIAFWIYLDSNILTQPSEFQETVFVIGQPEAMKSIAFKYIYMGSQEIRLTYSFLWHETEINVGSEYLDQWQHMMLTYDGVLNIKKIYTNGVLLDTTNRYWSEHATDEYTLLNLNANQSIEIGRDVQNSTYFHGKIRNFQMFNRNLTRREVYVMSLYPIEGLDNKTLDTPKHLSVTYNNDDQTFTPSLNTVLYENLEEHSNLEMTLKITTKAGFSKSISKTFYTGYDLPILSITNTSMSSEGVVKMSSDISAFDKTSTLTMYYAIFFNEYTKQELKTFFVDNGNGTVLLNQGENNITHSLSFTDETTFYENLTTLASNINTTYYLHVYAIDNTGFDSHVVSTVSINILANNFGDKTTVTNNTKNNTMITYGDSVTLTWQTSYISKSENFNANIFGLPLIPTSTDGTNWTITAQLPVDWSTNRSLSDPQFFSVSYFTNEIVFPNLICINITAPEMNITLSNVNRVGNTSNSETTINFIDLDTLKTSENPKGNDFSGYEFIFTATHVSIPSIVKSTIINDVYPTNTVISNLVGGNIYDIQVNITDAAGNSYISNIFTVQTKIPDGSIPTNDLTVNTFKSPPTLGYDINGYIYFVVGEIDVYVVLSDSATEYTDTEYTSLFTTYPSLKLTNYNSLNAFTNQNQSESVINPSPVSFSQYFDGTTLTDILTETQYYAHVVATIKNIGTVEVAGVTNDWYPTVHNLPKIPQTITVQSFTTTNQYDDKLGTDGDTINLLFNTTYPEEKTRIVYNLGVSDSHNVRLFNLNDDKMSWKITYDITTNTYSIPKTSVTVSVVNGKFVFDPVVSAFDTSKAYVFDNTANAADHPLNFHTSNERPEFKYTFEVSVLSGHSANWIVPEHIIADGVALFENNNFDRLEVLVYPQSAYASDVNINHLIDSDTTTYVNWRDNPQPVGTKLFNLYFKERVQNITIQHARPTYTPGWKIYENDVVVYTDTSNHGDASEPRPYNVIYSLNNTYSQDADGYVTVSHFAAHSALFAHCGVHADMGSGVNGTSGIPVVGIDATIYRYTFEVNVPNYFSTHTTHEHHFEWGGLNVKSIKANGRDIATWDKFVSATALVDPVYHTKTDINGMLDSATGGTVWMWFDVDEPGTRIFELVFEERITSFQIVNGRPWNGPGWNIYEDGVLMVSESTNLGPAEVPIDEVYTYDLPTQGISSDLLLGSYIDTNGDIVAVTYLLDTNGTLTHVYLPNHVKPTSVPELLDASGTTTVATNLYVPTTGFVGGFVYTFEVNHKQTAEVGRVVINQLKADNNTLDAWDQFVSIRPLHEHLHETPTLRNIDNVLSLTNSGTGAYISFTSVEVGSTLIELVTLSEVALFGITYGRPIYAPGLKIYQNGVLKLAESENRGSSMTPEGVEYTYSVSQPFEHVLPFEIADSIAFYDMGEYVAGSSSLPDATSNARDLTVYGSPAVDAGTNSVAFDGLNDYMKVDNIGNTSGAWAHTIAFWIYIPSDSPAGSSMKVFHIGPTSDLYGAVSFNISRNAGGYCTWSYDFWGLRTKGESAASGFPNSIDQWSHVVLSYDGTTQKVYHNGVHMTVDLLLEGDQPLNIRNANQPMEIGRDIRGQSYLDGKLRQFQVFDRVLSAEEIATTLLKTDPTFKYTFEISVASNYYTGDHGLGYIIKYVKANGNFLNSWDKFVNVAATAISPTRTANPIENITVEEASNVAAWDSTPNNGVGAVFFEIVTTERVTLFEIHSNSPSLTPGWKISENGNVVYVDTSNGGTSGPDFTESTLKSYSLQTFPFKYTFEINVLPGGSNNWVVPGYIEANGVVLSDNATFGALEMLVYPLSIHDQNMVINNLFINSSNTYINWRTNVQPVGSKLFNLYFTEKVENVTIYYGRPLYTPGWKIYENDVLIHTETTNHGEESLPQNYGVSYSL
uniref:Uncharacterized protein n=1 Tax=viral metagenome TaxID=1070528 RepID=A0A6C0BQF3_9ZZZZ